MSGVFTLAASRCKLSLAIAALSWLFPPPAAATTWDVGPTRAMTQPAQAAAVAKDGDRVVIDPGVYEGCAIWGASHLTIEARRPPSGANATILARTVIAGPVCGGRALFYFTGDDITVRGIIFSRARDTAHNGAGILMEGANLTVEDSQFLENENGILAGGPPRSVVRVVSSVFQRNGSCDGACAHAIYAGQRIARLEVIHCAIRDTHVGHGVKSRALSTVVRETRIEDGEAGTSSYLVELPNGGDAQIVNNIFEKGPRSDNKEVAISIGVPGRTEQANQLDIRGNRFVNDTPGAVIFVRNETSAQARLRGNTLVGRVEALRGPGTVE